MSCEYLIDFELRKLRRRQTDVLIIGGGVAGLTAALMVAGKLEVQVLAKGTIKQTSTWHAQGGIAVALAEEDSPELHLKDTMTAGGGLCDPEAVKVLVEEAADAVGMLCDLGTGFDKEGGYLRLGREGGHTVSRVVHAGDATGSAIAASLSGAAHRHKNIAFSDNVFVLDLLVYKNKCYGALVFDQNIDEPVVYQADAVLLAAGGMGQIYKVTTNPAAATGDGLAMAHRSGVKMSGLEFIQFHPTALVRGEDPRFLISEAVRGEGAYLVDKNGSRFMLGKHPLAELAPRDIVSKAVVETMRAVGEDHVFLDTRHFKRGRLKRRFPAIWAKCVSSGFDPSKDLIPIAPAAHYLIGGVVTDLFGRTSLSGLYASGETASTGVHGANRLASNSLLEGLVFSRRIGMFLLDHIKSGKREPRKPQLPDIKVKLKRPAGESLAGMRSELRQMMMAKVGVVRNLEDLRSAAEYLAEHRYIFDYRYDTPQDWETVNMYTIAGLIVAGALARRQSLGVHLVAG